MLWCLSVRYAAIDVWCIGSCPGQCPNRRVCVVDGLASGQIGHQMLSQVVHHW